MAITTGSTVVFRLEAKKDQVIWDITGATVVLRLIKPNETEMNLSATIINGPAGIAEYQATTLDLDAEGTWSRAWEVSLSGVILWSKRREFWVDLGA